MAEKVDAPEDPVAESKEALQRDSEDLLVMAKLDSTAQTLTLGGHPYTVTKLTVRQIGPFMVAIEPAIPFIMQSIARTKEIQLSLMVDAGVTDPVAAAISVITGAPVDQIMDMPADDFMVLAAKVLMVNMDFFFHRLPEISGLVKDAVLEAAQAVEQKITASGGGASFSASSATGTPSLM